MFGNFGARNRSEAMLIPRLAGDAAIEEARVGKEKRRFPRDWRIDGYTSTLTDGR